MEQAILFVDGTIKTFKTKEDMQRFMVETNYENIVLSGESKYVKVLQWKSDNSNSVTK